MALKITMWAFSSLFNILGDQSAAYFDFKNSCLAVSITFPVWLEGMKSIS